MFDLNSLVRRLADAGCSLEHIAIVENALQEELASERYKATVKKRRQRAKRALSPGQNSCPRDMSPGHKNLNEINGHVPGTRPTLSLSSSLKKEESKKERGNAGNVPLPEGWEPKPVHFQKGAELGFSAGQVNDAAEDMRLWAVSSNTRRTLRGWDATLHQFLRRNAKEKTKSLAKDPSTLNGRIRHGII